MLKIKLLLLFLLVFQFYVQGFVVPFFLSLVDLLIVPYSCLSITLCTKINAGVMNLSRLYLYY